MGQKSIRLGLGSLRVSSVSRSSSGWTIGAEGQDHAACPQCRTRSRSRHSFYRRRVRDLPIQGVPVLIDLKVSRWRCRNVGCEQKIFVERLPSVAPAHARNSERLAGIVEVLKEASPDFVRMRALAMRFRGVLRGVLSQTWNLREQKRLAELRIAHAARMSNCSAREGRGLKAYLACRLRIMAIISMPPRMVRALSADLNPSMGRTRLLMER